MESSSHKRAREAVDLAAAAAGEAALPEADAKRLRPQDLLDMLEDDTDAAAAGDLASVMRSLEEEIASFDEAVGAEEAPTQQQPELGFLLEASDDELGLPPAGAASSSEEAGLAGAPESAGAALDGQIWGFEDEIDGGGFGGYSPEAAAAAAAAAAWDDDGFDAGLFAFGDDACGPSDLAALRHETMPAV